MDGWRRRQIAQEQAQGMIGPNLVVTVGDDEEDWESSNPSAEESQQLERCSVRPMGVFANDDRWPRPRRESRKHLPKELVTRITVKGVLRDPQAERGGKVAHGTERTRGGQRVA